MPCRFSFRFSPLVLTFALAAGVTACAGNVPHDEVAPEEAVDVLYTKGADALDRGAYKEAAKNFAEVDRQHPYSSWALRAEIMEAFSYYKDMDYDKAIRALDQFIELHPGNADVAYAYYLKALCDYERIFDVKRDQAATRRALEGLQGIVQRFPDTEYARDASLKIGLIRDHLAGAEMDVGRYYLKRHLYIAAIGRFKTVVDRYQTTSHVPEALERLVECYVALGMAGEAQKNAAVLGYNFPGSDWYRDAYNLLKKKGLVSDGEK
ncbi:MAG: outer membrane protein assembly factor BamD [Alphaproteobacteria bacterium]|nr:outer membrane protein assembly factor BamD [Alphaproteobacteria bacterium]